jgi:hypothetical protein
MNSAPNLYHLRVVAPGQKDETDNDACRGGGMPMPLSSTSTKMNLLLAGFIVAKSTGLKRLSMASMIDINIFNSNVCMELLLDTAGGAIALSLSTTTPQRIVIEPEGVNLHALDVKHIMFS